ncbi:Caffeic acid 3-O-methyltransferase [Bienertia sinuspersici]
MATTSKIKPNNNEASSCSITNDDDEEEMSYVYAYRLVNSCTLPMWALCGRDSNQPTKINIPNPNALAMLDRMLQLLATYLAVECTTIFTTDGRVERRYSPSQVTKFLVVNDDRVSLAGLNNLLMDKTFLESWRDSNIVHGMSIFEYASVDSRLNEVFNKAMHQTTPFVMKKILEKYKGLENIQQLVEVGVGHVSGDMFQVIPKGDAIFMKALPKNGKAIVVEEIMADGTESTNSSRITSQMDVLMMIKQVLRNGKKQTTV